MSSDEIFIRNLVIETIIGILPHERTTLQPVEIDIVLSFDLSVAAESENISDTVDYVAVATGLSHFVRETQFELIESLADAIVKWLWAFSPAINRVQIELRKPQALSIADTVGLKIARNRPSFVVAEN